MKRTLLSAALALAANAAALFGAHHPTAVANIPYCFVANGVELPAGRYILESQLNIVRLSTLDGKTHMMIPASQVRATSAPAPARPELIMKRVSGRMHLVGMRDGRNNILRVLGS